VSYETRFDAPQQRGNPYQGDGSPAPSTYQPANSQPDPRQSEQWRGPTDHPGEPDRRQQERLVSIRNAALLRMREMNARHGMHAFDLRFGSNALGPHAVAFLYRDAGHEAGRAPHDVVKAATRLFRDSEEVRDLPTLLTTLAHIAAQYSQRGGFDPRTVMAHRTDSMSAQAQYIGVGVSSLDTLAGEWSDLGQRVVSALEVAGRSYIHLLDGTRMILDRGGKFGVVGITYSSQPLEAGQGISYTSWRPLHRRPGDYGDNVWTGLDALRQEAWKGIELMTQPAIRRHR